MKQLVFTSCRVGEGLEHGPGQQVRAASKGMTMTRLNALKPLLGYRLPAHVPLSTAVVDAPIRLAYLDDPTTPGDRVLVQSVYVAVDPASGRRGNTCAHMLVDLSPVFTGLAAIRAWRSPSWCHDSLTLPKQLGDVDAVSPGPLSEERLTQYLLTTAGYANLAFVLAATLCGTPGKRLFVVAEPDEVSLLIFGLMRLIPASLLRQVTFSTYERNPEDANSTLTGTWWPDVTTQDLPSRLYHGLGYTLHTGTGKRSEPPMLPRSAAECMDAARSGDFFFIDRFHQVCVDMQCETLDAVDLAFSALCSQACPIPVARALPALMQAPVLARTMAQEPMYANRLAQILLTLSRHPEHQQEVNNFVSKYRHMPDIVQPIALALGEIADEAFTLGHASEGNHSLAVRTRFDRTKPNAARRGERRQVGAHFHAAKLLAGVSVGTCFAQMLSVLPMWPYVRVVREISNAFALSALCKTWTETVRQKSPGEDASDIPEHTPGELSCQAYTTIAHAVRSWLHPIRQRWQASDALVRQRAPLSVVINALGGWQATLHHILLGSSHPTSNEQPTHKA